MKSDVIVAGVGIISAIGNNQFECIRSFETEQCGIGNISYLETVHKGKLPVAEVQLSNEHLSTLTGMKSTSPRAALLSCVAVSEAMNDAGLEITPDLRIGLVSANSVGGMDLTERFFSAFKENPNKGRLRDIVHHECGSITELVADHLGIRDHISTINTACSSSANTLIFGSRLIQNNILDIVIAGGADSLTKFTINGFNTLMILDQEKCKPFDDNRKGLNLGEGAGYLVLVSEKYSLKMKKVYCVLSGYSNTNDAFHQTASSPDGTGSYLAMKGALERSGLLTSDIDYINLHGTGTKNNDLAEGIAITRLFKNTIPKVSSTKSFTGHTLGACGGIEAVFSALSVKHGYLYPNLRFGSPLKEHLIFPEIYFSKKNNIKNVLSNSFGFGGNCSSLIFSKS